MGEIVEFQNPKDRILGNVSGRTTDDLNKELENFSFSRLPQRERIARILAAVVSWGTDEYDAQDYLEMADQLIPSVNNNFTKPYEFIGGDVDATA